MVSMYSIEDKDSKTTPFRYLFLERRMIKFLRFMEIY